MLASPGPSKAPDSEPIVASKSMVWISLKRLDLEKNTVVLLLDINGFQWFLGVFNSYPLVICYSFLLNMAI